MSSISARSRNFRHIAIGVSAFAGITLLASCDRAGTGESPVGEVEAAMPADEAAIHQARVDDLVAVADALQAYHDATGEYPTTDSNWRGVGWGGFKRGDAWIPALVPDYIDSLPADPAGGETKDDAQYIYFSDGTGYKLIAHNAFDVQYLDESGPLMIDPVRPERSYGTWTDGFSVY